MGPDSDLTMMEAATDVLSQFDVAHEIKVTSVHRTPEDVRSYVTEAGVVAKSILRKLA